MIQSHFKRKTIPNRALSRNPNTIKTQSAEAIEYTQNPNVEIFIAAENIQQFSPVFISNGSAYNASSIYEDQKPCQYIAVNNANTGEYVYCQNKGILNINTVYNDNDDIFFSGQKIQNKVTTKEHQYIGKCITQKTILLNISKPVKYIEGIR